MSTETWLALPGWEGYYEASDRGRIRGVDRVVGARSGSTRIQRGKILRPATAKRTGHLSVRLLRGGRGGLHKVHRLVLLTFAGPCPDGFIGCHNNGDPADNRIENLRWDTLKSNSQDRLRHGNDPNASKTHCVRGHEFSPENTYSYSYPYKNERVCKTCAISRRRTKESVA